uniref:Doublecortin domain-containing protein n=1 Tax=Onchocerca volvulus TaxID=6282 RepID=A0A8R1TJU1_ONCVO
MDTAGLDFNFFPTHPEHSVDLNYRGIRIKVYKNGDQYDTGTPVVICRKRFKHWLTFLDFLTKKLGLMAPVHEFYRTDGLHIRHFEEIENGGSYVAVSQGPFIHRQYGLPSEDREKWNINPKIEPPEQSALDSAESVDIYLKQRGYTSRTGLPFPFDGGVCVNHSLMDLGRNRGSSSNLSTRQHCSEQKSEENYSKNDELLEKNDAKPANARKEQQESNSELESELHLNSSPTICNTEFPSSISEVESKAFLHELETMNGQNIEQNNEILSMVEATNQITNKTGKNGLCDDIATQSDQKPSVKKYDECVPAVPIAQIPDSSREFSLAENAKNMESMGMIQTKDINDYSLPSRSAETVITIVNHDALVRRASNSSIIIVNISAGQKKHDDEINNVYNGGNKNAETGPSMLDKVTGTEVPSQRLEVKVALPDSTRIVDQMKDATAATAGARTPRAVPTNYALQATTTDRFTSESFNTKDQRPGILSLKKDVDDEYNGENSKINSKECSNDVLLRKNSNVQAEDFENFQNVILEQNLETKLRDSLKQKKDLEKNQSNKLVYDVSENNAESNDVSRNLKKPTLLSVQRSELEYISDNFEYNKENDITVKNQSGHINAIHGLKCRMQEDQSKDERPMINTISSCKKLQESLTTNKKNSPSRKQVTLATPSVATSTFISSAVDTGVKLKMESGKTGNFSDSEELLKSSSQQMTAANISATSTTSAITTAVITNTTSSNNITDTTHGTATSGDVIMHTTTREKKLPYLQKYRSESQMSFEADFTPRRGRMQKNSTNIKTVQKTKIDLDLNVDICRLPEQSSYDPDFKDYDFI